MYMLNPSGDAAMPSSDRPNFDGFIQDIETSLQVVEELEDILEDIRDRKRDNSSGRRFVDAAA
jgi:hypothetical protein